MILTHIGGPTVLIELDGWHLLTDPTFDPAGGHYDFGWGTSSDKLAGPALGLRDLPHIDAVLLSHDRHGDNLDAAGRQLLPAVGTVLTTVSGARRLGLPNALGMAPGEVTVLQAANLPPLEVTATPAHHGPPLSGPVVGDVVGFAVRRAGEEEVRLWVTGDTVLHRSLRRVAARLRVDVALVHVGGVRFAVTGPVRYTMTGRRAVELVALTRPRVAVPVHYEGWSHFRSGRPAVEEALALAPSDVRHRVRWLIPGEPYRSTD
ncbi:MBL fold metallo-hydrolase [Ornithinimicrobium sufpigmenti]|uniref:MBL fold metallo-hydrolase n=1 Tax=Ornithinimicrobium sufpigmenti TaxID=2508882 RepID=UPI001036564C|nr:MULTISPECIES: MBL fold metallo-hydrolase [unclassified Ornithinimicrobium]